MDSHLTDTLDTALHRLLAGEPLPQILADYPEQAAELAPLLQTSEMVANAHSFILLSAEAAQADRAAFLDGLQGLPSAHVGWLARWRARIADWFVVLLPLQRQSTVQKERHPMSMLVAKLALVLVLLTGAAGGTAVASTNSLPDSALYPVKLAIEEMRLNNAQDPEDQAFLHLQLAQVRIQEMEQLALNGTEPGEAALTRLQNHLQTALQLAANAPDERMNGILIQAHLMLQGAGPGLLQAQMQTQGAAYAALGNAYQIMNQIGTEVDAGLQDPQAFRWRYMHNRPGDLPVPPVMSPNPGGVITHTIPLTPTWPIGPGEPGYGPGEPGGNVVPPNGPNSPDSPGPNERPGSPPDAGFGPGNCANPIGNGQNGNNRGNPDNSGNGGNNGGDNGGGNGGGH